MLKYVVFKIFGRKKHKIVFFHKGYPFKGVPAFECVFVQFFSQKHNMLVLKLRLYALFEKVVDQKVPTGSEMVRHATS